MEQNEQTTQVSNQAQSGGRYNAGATLQANRQRAQRTAATASTKSNVTDKLVKKATGLNQDQLDAGADQLRSHLDRQQFAMLATGAGILLSFLLVTVRGLATLKATQSLPTKYIRFTERNIYTAFANMSKKAKPFTFTKFMGPYVGFFGLAVITLLVIFSTAMYMLPIVIPALAVGTFFGFI